MIASRLGHRLSFASASPRARVRLLLCLAAASPWTALAACSSNDVAAPGDGGAQDGTAGDSANDGASSTSDGAASDSGALADGDAGATVDGGEGGATDAGCSSMDAMPDVARGATCTQTQKTQRWPLMLQQPVRLPNRAAGLDLAGPTDGGLTLAQAEDVDCQSDDQGDLFGDCERVASWGDNAEVWMEYKRATGVGRMIVLWPGYQGTLDFKSPDNASTYSIGISRQITKNGSPFTLDTGWSGAGFDAEVDEIYRGIIATFAPQVALDAPGVTCRSTQKCGVGKFGDVGYVIFKSVGFALWVANTNAPQPSPSIPNRFDVDPR